MASSSSSQVQQQPINYSSDAATTASSNTTVKPPAAFDEDLFLFVPRLGDIIKRYMKKNLPFFYWVLLFLSFEKNPTEVKTKLDDLRKQFESCHEMISRLEGIDTTIDDQRAELDKLDNELKSKTDLLKKHIQLCKFDLNMPPKPARIVSETDDDLTHQSSQNASNAMNINDYDDELFQTDENHTSQQETHQENLSSFF